MADLDEIMSGSGSDSATEQTPATEQVSEGRLRDEQGRFAAQQAAPEAPQQPAAQPQEGQQQEQRPPDGFIPIQALDARLAKERERSDAALRQQNEQFQRMMMAIQQQARPAQQPQQPQVPFVEQLLGENGEAAIDSRLQQAMQPIQQGQTAIVENFSRMMATDKFGEEAVNAAYTEMQTAMATNPRAVQFDYQRIMHSPHPYAELVKWHQNKSVLSKYSDEKAIEAEIERRLAERTAQAPQAGQQPQAAQQAMPQSFTQARSAGGGAAPQWSGPVPLSDLMGR